MKQIGYSLLEIATGEEMGFKAHFPASFEVPGVVRITFDAVGQEDGENKFRCVERWLDETVPADSKKTGETASAFDGSRIVVTYVTRPMTAEEIADRDAALAEQQKTETETAEVKADTWVQTFIQMSPTEVAAYVDANTNNVAQIRALLKKIAIMELLLARRMFRD